MYDDVDYMSYGRSVCFSISQRLPAVAGLDIDNLEASAGDYANAYQRDNLSSVFPNSW